MPPLLSSIRADYRQVTSIDDFTDAELLAIVAGACAGEPPLPCRPH
jgi:hypothetical protein